MTMRTAQRVKCQRCDGTGEVPGDNGYPLNCSTCYGAGFTYETPDPKGGGDSLPTKPAGTVPVPPVPVRVSRPFSAGSVFFGPGGGQIAGAGESGNRPAVPCTRRHSTISELPIDGTPQFPNRRVHACESDRRAVLDASDASDSLPPAA
jgi:hypothetical protein